MTKTLKSLFIGALLVTGSFLAGAQPSAHYCPGSEGLLGPSLPPPGVYLRDYNVFYYAENANNSSGQNVAPNNFKAFTYAQVPRLVWVSDTKFLGGNLGSSVLLPFVYESVQSGPYKSSTFGMGDLMVDGLLIWHPKQFDIVLAPAVWAPTGDSATPPTTRAGLGYWEGMFTAGATWYMDTDKTWALSALNRYELPGEQRDTHITPGQAYTLEWGLSKKLHEIFQVGAAGYYQQQITSDSGAGATAGLNRVAAVGPEVCVLIPKIEVNASLRCLYEFMAENRAQGQTVALTLTKRF